MKRNITFKNCARLAAASCLSAALMGGLSSQALAASQGASQNEPLPYYFVVGHDGSLEAHEIDSQFLHKLFTMGIDIMPYISATQQQQNQGTQSSYGTSPSNNTYSIIQYDFEEKGGENKDSSSTLTIYEASESFDNTNNTKKKSLTLYTENTTTGGHYQTGGTNMGGNNTGGQSMDKNALFNNNNYSQPQYGNQNAPHNPAAYGGNTGTTGRATTGGGTSEYDTPAAGRTGTYGMPIGGTTGGTTGTYGTPTGGTTGGTIGTHGTPTGETTGGTTGTYGTPTGGTTGGTTSTYGTPTGGTTSGTTGTHGTPIGETTGGTTGTYGTPTSGTTGTYGAPAFTNPTTGSMR